MDYAVRQHLIEDISGERLNEMLDEGARVVWIQTRSLASYHVVLETYADPPVSPEMIVLDFLSSVDPGKLEEMMLENADYEQGPGVSAIRSLIMMVPSAPQDGDKGDGT